MVKFFIFLMENNLVPDFIIRHAVRYVCSKRLNSLKCSHDINAYAQGLSRGPLAEHTALANEQHYELPERFFGLVLGIHRKYSCSFYESDDEDLSTAEERALEASVQRAEISDGMSILELGCGWGSLTFYMAKKFPHTKILAISNSNSQRLYILEKARKENLKNINVLTLDISSDDFSLIQPAQFDRLISIEMFEHFKNYEILLERCSYWLKTNGKMFVHVFTHKTYSYPFEVQGEDDWMAKHFFTGGQMPSEKLLTLFNKNLIVEKQWKWSGWHYKMTAEAWLKNFDLRKKQISEIFSKTYGTNAPKWIVRWRIFFISVSELFGYNKGEEWGISHYLFAQNKTNK